MQQSGSVTLRIAVSADYAALLCLAQLDSKPLPPGPHLIAEREGRIDAALSLRSREVVADPFQRTAELCDLLRHHAAAIDAPTDDSHTGFLPRRPILRTA
jgi:hypothetical protein